MTKMIVHKLSKTSRSRLIGVGIGVLVDLLIMIIVPGSSILEVIVALASGFLAGTAFMKAKAGMLQPAHV